MPEISSLISDSARQTMRETIQESGGNEVFFLAYTDDAGIITEASPLARGNDSAVPALLQVARQGDVILHNHPSGLLIPSGADVNLASEYGNKGVGFYILNNTADQVYVVVAAFRRTPIHLLDPREIERLLSPRGAVARQLKDYESRPEQIRMISAVVEAFNKSGLALIEAGTGTGKSLSYLLPAVFWSARNQERVVISTNTINLQEQLIYKDIPFLQGVLDFPFKAVLVKGRNNYVCLQKIENLRQEGEYLIETEERAEIKVLMDWAGSTSDGSRADLGILPRSGVWEKVACDSDQCTRIKCPFYSRCFFYRARREAAAAQILVVNHHLLFSDLAIRGQTGNYRDTALLPSYRRIVLDEAHNVEEIATEYFGEQLSRNGFQRLLSRLYALKEKEKIRERGYLPFLLVKLRGLESRIDLNVYLRIHQQIDAVLLPLRENLAFQAGQSFEDWLTYFEGSDSGPRAESKIRLTPQLRQREDWKQRVLPAVRQLIQEIRDFFLQLSTLEKWLGDLADDIQDELAPQLVELGALLSRLEATALGLASVFSDAEDGQVRWVECQKGKNFRNLILKQAPLEVAELLRERVFTPFPTVVLTSATLTTETSFQYIKHRLGLDSYPPTRLAELQLPSSFNYKKQVVLGILNSLPSPDQPQFAKDLSRVILKSILASGGRALILFTSYSLLFKTYQELAESLRALNIRPLRQGEAPRHRLTQTFKEDKTSVLFATDSFWEGVDVAGDALENVILTKLPFSVPREPIIQARVESIELRGGNAFLEYSVPQAVIKFKQGFGRLIRKKTDRGSIMIFDRRVLEKYYGKIFLNSLPDCRLIKGGEEEVFEKVREFFQRQL
jgi:ATP-dependent DNA helicase DinG